MAETQEIQKRAEGPVAKIRDYLDNVDVKGRLEDILGKRAAAFGNSIVNVVSGSKQLMEVARNNPGSIMRAAMKAATINLPIDPALGQAAIVPYGSEAVFQIMYRGVIQLCVRSGQYKKIHCSEIYADELKSHNPIIGEVKFNDPTTYKMRYADNSGQNVVGHYAYFRLTSGFEKAEYMTKAEVMAHAKKYSKAFQYDLSKGKKASPWSTDPIPMGNKTVLLKLLKRFGIMSIEMQDAITAERETFDEAQANASRMIKDESGSDPIDTTFEENGDSEQFDAETKAKVDAEKKKLREADKKAKAKQAKAKAKDKDAKPKYHCRKCGKDFDELNAEDPVKGWQCHCLSWSVELNHPEKEPAFMAENTEIDPDIREGSD